MSLTLNETFRVDAPADRVWQFLKDPAQVVTCLPGAELTDTIDAQTYAGRVKVKVGPITAAYAGKATLAQVDDVARRMQIVAEGKESGGAGSARMTMTGSVITLADGASEVSVDASIDIAGRVMQFGRGLIESVNKQLFKQFADSVQAKLQAAYAAERSAPSEPPSAATPTAATPSAATPSAATSTAANVADTASGTPEPAAAKASAAEPPSPAAPSVARASAAPVAPNSTTRRAPSAAAAASAPIAQGEELRALPLLWKVFVAWIRGLFGGKR